MITISPNDFYAIADRNTVADALRRSGRWNNRLLVTPLGNGEFMLRPDDQVFFGDEGRNLRIRAMIVPPLRDGRTRYYVLTQMPPSRNEDTLEFLISAICGLIFIGGVFALIRRNNQNLGR